MQFYTNSKERIIDLNFKNDLIKMCFHVTL
jgi:hypothetical protein